MQLNWRKKILAVTLAVGVLGIATYPASAGCGGGGGYWGGYGVRYASAGYYTGGYTTLTPAEPDDGRDRPSSRSTVPSPRSIASAGPSLLVSPARGMPVPARPWVAGGGSGRRPGRS